MPSQQRMSNRAALLTLAALVVASTSCSCETGHGKLLEPSLQLDPPGLVDFGTVPIGSLKVRTVTLRNLGTAALTIRAEEPGVPFQFNLPIGGLTVPVSGSAELQFAFLPSNATDGPDTASVQLLTNEREGAGAHRLELRGRGVVPGLDCIPSEIDFGPILLGGAKKARTTCTNRLAVATVVELTGFSGRGREQFAAQSVDPNAVPGQPFTVPAGESVEIEIVATAAIDGTNGAVLRLHDTSPSPNELARIEVSATGVRSAVLLEPTHCQDFGFVPVGVARELPFTVRNIGFDPVVVESVVVDAGDARGFTVASPLPITVAPDGLEYLSVAFQPEDTGERTVRLKFVVTGSGPEGTELEACVTGAGGGPMLSCAPAAIDFGMAAVGIPVTRTLRCANAGFAPPGQITDPLIIDHLYSNGSAFQASEADIRNPDGTTGARPEGYLVDESFALDVVYAPFSESSDVGEVKIETRSTPGGVFVTPVSGRGRNVPPCEFELRPDSLDFGTVDQGQTRTLRFTLVNTLVTGPCLISDLRLSDDSDGAFSITPIENLELAVGEKLKVPVTFAPVRYQPDVTGAVQFQISRPDEPLRTVPLRGTAARPCLKFEPSAIDFGKAGPGCRTRERLVELRSQCPTPVTLDGLSMYEGDGSDAFMMGSHLNFPLVLPFLEGVEVRVHFSPRELGGHSGTLRAVAGPDSYLVELEGVGEAGGVQTDTFLSREPTFFLRGSPDDRNGDGVRDENDIDVTIDGRPMPQLTGTGLLVWTFNPLSDAITFHLGVSHATATYDVRCIQ